jgi:hypothetical protein
MGVAVAVGVGVHVGGSAGVKGGVAVGVGEARLIRAVPPEGGNGLKGTYGLIRITR